MSTPIIAIIQARMSSSRLPGKVLLDIGGKPMLEWVVERTRKAAVLDEVVVATTTDPTDDPIAEFCAQKGYTFTRGSLYDVLDRYIQAAREFNTGIIARITADCPFIDPAVIDQTVRALFAPDKSLILDFAANRLPPPWGRSYPIGLDVEVCTREALERTWNEATEAHHREHVMPFLYDDLSAEALPQKPEMTPHENNDTPPELFIGPREEYLVRSTTPHGFRVAVLHHAPNYGTVRWTVDTPEDLEALRALATLLPKNGFSWYDALTVWRAHPEIAAINSDVQHKSATDVDRRATY